MYPLEMKKAYPGTHKVMSAMSQDWCSYNACKKFINCLVSTIKAHSPLPFTR